MKSFIAIFQALFWFALCITAAFFLLAVAFAYNGYMVLKKGFRLKKLELTKLQLAK